MVLKLESTVNVTTLSFPSDRQDLDESDKVLESKTAPLADGLWAIKITNLTVGAKKFRQVSSRNRSLVYSKIS